ncbi:MAG: hypothetical protein LBL79_05335 [Prevotella sp.]|jgi:hypothetical protein|nr:hypothetical protein [Prevotella sp.]
MENRLILNDDVKTFLEIDNKPVWKLIIENDINSLLALPAEDAGNDILAVAKELFSDGESHTLKEYDFVTIREPNGAFIRDLVRLIFALDINGTQDEMLKRIADALFDSFPGLIEQIQKETFGYPARMVANYILSESAAIRAALMNLIYYYKIRQDIDALHFVTVMRTTITLAIMRNYKNIVGHDMVETAKIKEVVGEPEAALTFYNGARENLENELRWFVESPEMGPNEDDAVVLQSLKEAYQAIDRLNNTGEYVKACSLIDEILSREYIEYDFDEEDDGEDE